MANKKKIVEEVEIIDHDDIYTEEELEEASWIKVKAIHNVDQLHRGEIYVVDPNESYWALQLQGGNVVEV